MGPRERILQLERQYDKLKQIKHLTQSVYNLQEELSTIKTFLGIKITTGPHVIKVHQNKD